MDRLGFIKRILICFAVGIISSCGINSKDSYLESFNKFISDIELCETFTKEDLTTIKKKYLDYTETYYEKYKDELTSIEKEQISKLKARYYAVMTKQGLKDVGSVLKEIGDQANEFINNILDK